MNPDDLKKILDALQHADVREFSLQTGSFALDLKRGPQAFTPPAQVAAAPASVMAAPMMPTAPSFQPPAPSLEAPSVPTVSPASEAPTPPAPAAEAAPAAPARSAGTPVKAPIVGTFYSASSPDAAPFVKVGDTVSAGQVLCIIEAMKLMNEIEAEQGGTVREIMVKNAEPVEYGQTLFIIE